MQTQERLREKRRVPEENARAKETDDSSQGQLPVGLVDQKRLVLAALAFEQGESKKNIFDLGILQFTFQLIQLMSFFIISSMRSSPTRKKC